MPEPVPMTLPSSLKWSACNNIWSFFVSMFRLGVSSMVHDDDDDDDDEEEDEEDEEDEDEDEDED